LPEVSAKFDLPYCHDHQRRLTSFTYRAMSYSGYLLSETGDRILLSDAADSGLVLLENAIEVSSSGGAGMARVRRDREVLRHTGEAHGTAAAALSAARGHVQINIEGSAHAIARPPSARGLGRQRFAGRSQVVGQPVRVVATGHIQHHFTGRSRVMQRPARSLSDGYATRGRSERDILTALFL
jgi:hypothetical protein